MSRPEDQRMGIGRKDRPGDWRRGRLETGFMDIVHRDLRAYERWG